MQKTPTKSRAKPKKVETPDKNEEAAAEGDEEEGDGEEEEEGEAEPPLLERTLELTGKRQRKSTQRLEFVTQPKKKVKIEEGKGKMLGELPRVVYFMDKKENQDIIKNLHRIATGTYGKRTEMKKNLKKFNGFSFGEDSEEYEKRKGFMSRYFMADLKRTCELLDVERGGSKEEIIERIIKFMLEPKESDKKGLPTPVKKRKSKTPKKKATGAKIKAPRKKKEAATEGKSENEAAEESGEDSDASDKEEGDKLR